LVVEITLLRVGLKEEEATMNDNKREARKVSEPNLRANRQNACDQEPDPDDEDERDDEVARNRGVVIQSGGRVTS
jgi:hypothetical protein